MTPTSGNRAAEPGLGSRPRGLAEATWAAVERWFAGPAEPAERAELAARVAAARAGDRAALAELDEAFAGVLPIGTGGRRGPTGLGPNRINSIVVAQTARATLDLLRHEGRPARVAVVYDTRRHSPALARRVVGSLALAGAEVHWVDAPRATPLLSFVVRALELSAGFVITASHNPPGDNGIKVYGADGAQVFGERDRVLAEAIAALDRAPLARIVERGPGPVGRVVRYLPAEGPGPGDELDPAWAGSLEHRPIAALDEPYLAFVGSTAVGLPAPDGPPLRVVFSALHGVGETNVVPALARAGIEIVERVHRPDGGAFSEVASANPEVPAALDRVAARAAALGVDLALASDPDADRLGALAPAPGGEWRFLDGNQLGVLMLDHLLECGAGVPGGLVVTTVVSSPLIATMARAAGLEVVDDLLVGFKHHAALIEEHPARPVVFACEESHGYLRFDAVRDKDGAIAALLACGAAARVRPAGGPWARLRELWARWGVHVERTSNLWAEGRAGQRGFAAVMRAWRAEPPARLGEVALASVTDRRHPGQTGSAVRDRPSDLLVLEYAGADLACRVALRPSGTEPKLKLYLLARTDPHPDPEARHRWLVDRLGEIEAAARGLAERQLAAALEAGGA